MPTPLAENAWSADHMGVNPSHALITLAMLSVAPTALGAPHTVAFTAPDEGRPLAIAAAPNDDMWVVFDDDDLTLATVAPDGTVTDRSSLLDEDDAPRGVVAGPDGNMWITLSGANRIARVAPNGTVTRFATGVSGGEPTGITVGPDNRIWYTLAAANRLGRLDPTTGVATTIASGMIHGGSPTAITTGGDGRLYFTYDNSAAVGTVTLSATPQIDAVYPAFTMGERFAGITPDPRGGVFVGRYVLPGTDGGVARVTPDNTVEVNSLGLATVRAVTLAGDGQLYAGDRHGANLYAASRDPFALTQTLGAVRRVQAITRDRHGNVWAAGDSSPARVWRVGVMAPTVSDGTVTATDTTASVRMTVNAMGQETSYHVRYGGEALSARAAGTLDDRSSAGRTVTLTLSGLTPNTTYRYALGADNGSGSATASEGTFRTTGPAALPPPASPAPPSAAPSPSPTAGTPGAPDQGRAVVITPVSGTVSVRLPGQARDLPLAALGGRVPVGATVDATRGRVSLSSAIDRGARTQTGQFWGTRFVVSQERTGRGYTVLRIPPVSARECAARTRTTIGAKARSRKKRTLWGSDKNGLFRTEGSNSVATVRGTVWSTTESCEGTTTFVQDGAVDVLDRHTRRTVSLAAGQSYTALARGARVR